MLMISKKNFMLHNVPCSASEAMLIDAAEQRELQRDWTRMSIPDVIVTDPINENADLLVSTFIIMALIVSHGPRVHCVKYKIRPMSHLK